MRWLPPVGPALVAATATVVLIACEGAPFAGGGGPGPEQVGLQLSDVPVDLQRCSNSGAADHYLANLNKRNHAAYQTLQGAWTQLKGEGAQFGAVTVFAASPAACWADLGGGPGRTASSFVISFQDEGAAKAAYRRGILGFPTPAPEQQVPGLAEGVATGLSENAWVVQRVVDDRALYLAWWQERGFAVFFVASDLDGTESRRAAVAVEARAR